MDALELLLEPKKLLDYVSSEELRAIGIEKNHLPSVSSEDRNKDRYARAMVVNHLWRTGYFEDAAVESLEVSAMLFAPQAGLDFSYVMQVKDLEGNLITVQRDTPTHDYYVPVIKLHMLFPDKGIDEVQQLASEYHRTKSTDIAATLFQKTEKLIQMYARRIHRRVGGIIRLEDCYSAGNVAYMDAIKMYEPSRGTPFIPYLSFRVRGKVLDEIRANDTAPRRLRTMLKAIGTFESAFESEHGVLPVMKDYEGFWESKKYDMRKLYAILNGELEPAHLESMHEVVDEHGTELHETLADKKIISPDKHMHSKELGSIIESDVKTLPSTMRSAVYLYFYEGKTLQDTAAKLQVSESRVYQLLANAREFHFKKTKAYIGIDRVRVLH